MDTTKEQTALEKFLSTLTLEKWAWVRDKKPSTCIAAGELADKYELELTNQGSNFTLQLLAKLYWLFHIHPIRISPYHPQMDGLVKRFNQTLTGMLRKPATNEGKDWDKLVRYLLFAYREVRKPPWGSHLLNYSLWTECVRATRRPQAIMGGAWAKERRKCCLLCTIYAREIVKDDGAHPEESLQEILSKAQGKQKTWYDKNVQVREFEPVDPILVLLPTSSSKLLEQWQGVVKHMGKVNYLIDMHDCRKRRKCFT